MKSINICLYKLCIYSLVNVVTKLRAGRPWLLTQ